MSLAVLSLFSHWWQISVKWLQSEGTLMHTQKQPHTHKAQCFVFVRGHVPRARWVLRAVNRAAASSWSKGQKYNRGSNPDEVLSLHAIIAFKPQMIDLHHTLMPHTGMAWFGWMFRFWVTLYFKVFLLQCNYTFKYWVILINYMFLLYG